MQETFSQNQYFLIFIYIIYNLHTNHYYKYHYLAISTAQQQGLTKKY